MTLDDIRKRLIDNDALFNNIYIIEQSFDILPNDHPHFGAAISYQDISELRKDFLDQLIDTVVDWVYSSEKYDDLKKCFISSGKSEAAAVSQIIRKAKQKFRRGNDTLLIQGQLGELLLFHFIQHIKQAVPLLRKMPITTSSEHERYGADAIHYKVDGKNNVIILGEANVLASSRFITTHSLDLWASSVSGSSFRMRSASQVAPALYRISLFRSEISKDDRLVSQALRMVFIA